MTSAFQIDRALQQKKPEVLSYLRHRAAEAMTEIQGLYGSSQHKKRASAINRALVEERDRLLSSLRQASELQGWERADFISTALLFKHSTNVVMLEARNKVWPYEYMAFSRRIGELWEPFCTTCFDPPVREDVRLFVPPLFEEIRSRLASEIRSFIAALSISDEDKAALVKYYEQVWSLVQSGEIKLALDLHFEIGSTRHVVDFKSGFGSNEKGNTNRLLLVASIYRNIEPSDYQCLILVRSEEDETNNYLQTLKNSGLWGVHCGDAAYEQVGKYSGFDLKGWVRSNIDWLHDFEGDTRQYLEENDLTKYLTW